jgi:hypothetical protein
VGDGDGFFMEVFGVNDREERRKGSRLDFWAPIKILKNLLHNVFRVVGI